MCVYIQTVIHMNIDMHTHTYAFGSADMCMLKSIFILCMLYCRFVMHVIM